jgi:phage terminase large subunit-like protein
MAGLAVFHMLTVPSAQVFIAAADLTQADEMFEFAQHYCESEPELLRLVRITDSKRTITMRRNLNGKPGRRGRIKVLASDKSQGGGKKHSVSRQPWR